MSARLSDYSEINSQVGTVIRQDTAGPCSAVFIDVEPAISGMIDYCELDTILFQNYYTSSITVLQETAPGNYSTVLENFILMKDAHSEFGAQKWCTLSVEQFNISYKKGKALRLRLFQPSGHWSKFEIRSIKLFRKADKKYSNKMDGSSQAGTSDIDSVFRNVSDLISHDFRILSEASKNQRNFQDYTDAKIAISDYKKSAKKKDKRHGHQKRSASVSAPSSSNTPVGSATGGTDGALESGDGNSAMKLFSADNIDLLTADQMR